VVAVDDTTPESPPPESPLVTDDEVEYLTTRARSSSFSIGDLAIDLPKPRISDGHWPASGAKNSTKKDVYLFIHDKVYNVSSFIDEHP
jgi:cytochrome b involved in lipid metabolism